MRERLNQFKLILIILDFFTINLVFNAALFFRFDLQVGGIPPAPYNPPYYALLSIIFTVFEIFVFFNFGHYSQIPTKTFSRIFKSVFLKVSGVFLVLLGLLFFFREISYSRLTLGYFLILNIFAITFFHTFLGWYYRKNVFSKVGKTKFAIIGKETSSFLEKLKKDTTHDLSFAGFLNSEENLEELHNFLEKNKIRLVIITLAESNNQKIIDFCRGEGIKVKILPAFPGVFSEAKIKVEHIGESVLLDLETTQLARFRNRFLKRVFDFSFAFLILVLLIPLILTIIILIKLTSKGQVFFKQERLGLDNKIFTLYKFRTMFEQSETNSNTVWTTENDARVTPLGRFLRKTSLDELPQFWNVLKGQMSVVGPRPERPHFAN
ncbi:exopolysaccharide biosynthesis polyprenyl glycosylphosphotransferase, partial [bacterium]|nr:exopolysaccharide biosynthesis polyprenyl glycosylphosphotransferase [bacterium]